MDRIDVTVEVEDDNVRLTRGTPDELGLRRVSSHMVLSSPYVDIMLWLIGPLGAPEKQNVVQGVLDYLDQTI